MNCPIFSGRMRLLVVLLAFLCISVINFGALPVATVLADEPDGLKVGLSLETSSEVDLTAEITNRRIIFIQGYPTLDNVPNGPQSNDLNDARDFWLENPNSLGAFLRENLPLDKNKFLFHSYDGSYINGGFTLPAYLKKDVCESTGAFVQQQAVLGPVFWTAC